MCFPEIGSLKIKHLITVTYETQKEFGRKKKPKKVTLELKLFAIVPNKNGQISANYASKK